MITYIILSRKIFYKRRHKWKSLRSQIPKHCYIHPSRSLFKPRWCAPLLHLIICQFIAPLLVYVSHPLYYIQVLVKQLLETDRSGSKFSLYHILLLFGVRQIVELLNFSDSLFPRIKFGLTIFSIRE